MRLNKTKGETSVEFPGGRILRPTGKKDRHSKVCTAKGPRDRRVRLSANTAIRFYDVQDRLGCDRPSKAIDWLMKEAKVAIDALNSTATVGYETEENLEKQSPNYTVYKTEENRVFSNPEFGIQNQQHFNYNPTNSFSFFSMNEFQNYPKELNSRTRTRAQDISFSPQSIQRDSILQQSPISSSDQQGLFSSSIPLEFDAAPDMSWFQAMVTWNSNSNSNSGNGSNGSGDGNIGSFLGQNQFISQREPLQSSFSPSIRIPAFSSSSLAGIGLGNDGFSGFSISPQIQGQEEDNSACNKLHSASSVLHYQDLQNY